MSDQPDVTPDPDAEPSAAVTPGAADAQDGDPGARPVDEDAPDVTQHVGRDESLERAGDEDTYEQAEERAGVTGATGISPSTRPR